MLKWFILLIILVLFVFWLARGRAKNGLTDAEAKEIEQKRFYVSTEGREDPPAEDDRDDEL